MMYGTPELAPQGFFGNMLSGFAPQLGGAIGGAFGQQHLGNAIGQGASPLLRLLPFQVDPISAAYASGAYQAQVFKIVSPVDGIFIAEIEARPGALAANIGVNLPGLFERIVYISIIWASARRETMLAVNACLGIHKYGHLFHTSSM